MGLSSTDFEPWLSRWALIPDGEPIVTGYAGSRLLPVRRGDARAMLKLSRHPEERRAPGLLTWWAGEGAVRLLAHQEEATLLERAVGGRSLVEMARGDEDAAATRILCQVADALHAERAAPRPAGLLPLRPWLRALPAAAGRGGFVTEAAELARRLLEEDQESCVLHGDLHHGNVLDGGARGWLAIDPKGIFGPRAYDYANILCNPDAETALAPGRLDRQAPVIADAARLPIRRVLEWLFVHATISGLWCEQDGFDPTSAFAIARMAQTILNT